VLFARAEVARDVLSDGLAAKGWTVDVVDAYRTVRVDYDDDTRRRVSAADAVTFTSSSSARHFVQAMGGSDVAADSAPPVVACIGPVTAGTARDLGLDVTTQAEVHSIDGLVKSVVDALADRPS
jgi:uroporphyrinogen-III synthase